MVWNCYRKAIMTFCYLLPRSMQPVPFLFFSLIPQPESATGLRCRCHRINSVITEPSQTLINLICVLSDILRVHRVQGLRKLYEE